MSNDAKILIRLLRQDPTPQVHAIYVALMIRLGVRGMWLDFDVFDN